MIVIIVNRDAGGLKKNPRIRAQIHALFANQVQHIIDEDQQHDVIDQLNAIEHPWSSMDRLYVVGGDGTFSHILNWIASFPSGERPRLMSVGGGQFCYMTRFHGLRSKNPVKNLRAIFAGRMKLKDEDWESLCITDSLTKQKRFAAVMATGVVSDLLQWYEQIGKGGILKVIRIILMAIVSVVSDRLRRRIDKIHLLTGQLTLGTTTQPSRAYAGVTFSTIPELLASCHPFRGQRYPHQFYAIAYWGGLRRLAMAAPLIWFGKTPFWTKDSTFNEPIGIARVETSDPRIVLDGDLYLWPDSQPGKRVVRTITVTTGDSIPILVVDS